jgi:hypothetical protein
MDMDTSAYGVDLAKMLSRRRLRDPGAWRKYYGFEVNKGRNVLPSAAGGQDSAPRELQLWCGELRIALLPIGGSLLEAVEVNLTRARGTVARRGRGRLPSNLQSRRRRAGRRSLALSLSSHKF